MRVRPVLRLTTSPACSSTARCLPTATSYIGNGSASALTLCSPSLSFVRIARRVGSLSAAKVLSRVTERLTTRFSMWAGRQTRKGGQRQQQRQWRVATGSWRLASGGRLAWLPQLPPLLPLPLLFPLPLLLLLTRAAGLPEDVADGGVVGGPCENEQQI